MTFAALLLLVVGGLVFGSALWLSTQDVVKEPEGTAGEIADGSPTEGAVGGDDWDQEPTGEQGGGQAAGDPGQSAQEDGGTGGGPVTAGAPGASGTSTPSAEAPTAAGPCPDPNQVRSVLTGVTPEAEGQVRVTGLVTNASTAEVGLRSARIDLYDAVGNPVDRVIAPLSDPVAPGGTREWSAITGTASPEVTKGALLGVDSVWSEPAHASCPTTSSLSATATDSTSTR